jgi:hypothetical protein
MIFASLTTREPPYHKNLLNTINLLSKGNFDKIYLSLPLVSKNGVKYTVPNSLPHNVEVVWLDKDYGPICKILGGLKKQKNGTLITFDDDYNYKTNNIKNTLEKASKEDDSNVYSFSGTYINNFDTLPCDLSVDGGWHDTRYMFDFGNKKRLTTLGGYSGVAYPLHLIDYDELIQFIKSIDLFNNKILFKNDDVVLSAYLASKKIPIIMLESIDIGDENKDISEEVLKPGHTDIVEATRHPNIVEYFKSNNNSRFVLPQILLLILIVISVILFYIYINK